ncbi:MAG: hypothetical protein K8I82_25525, partial [Anaerolineae bacterium]|nr:hypothetical protein [Anaerolineae bacterium]
MTRRTLFFLWLGWYIALVAFQQVNWARFTLQRPDDGYAWTGGMTTGRLDGPATGGWFYARWDSYRYIRIARNGYADPKLATFFPGYPLLMRITDEILLSPLVAEDSKNSRMALAGVMVSCATSLVAAWGMMTLAKDRLGSDEDAFRCTFYMLIFPTAMFMVQVYTESAYLAVSLWALVLIYRGHWAWAVPLMIYATLTRPTGIFLCFPVLTQWLDSWWRGQRHSYTILLAAASPVITFFLFNTYLGNNGIDTFKAQQDFGRY